MLIIWKNRRPCVSMFIGGILGCLIYFAQPISWRAEAIVLIGHVKEDEQLIFTESLYTAVERIKSPGFCMSVSQSLGGEVSSEDIRRGLSIRPLRDGQSFVVSVDTNSSKRSGVLINLIVDQIIKKHDAIIDITKSRLLEKLKRQDQYKKLLEKQSINKSTNSSNLLNEVLMKLSMINQLNELNKTEDAIAGIRPTKSLEQPFVVEQKRFPSLFLTVLIGAFLGLLLSFILKNNDGRL